MDKKTEIEVDGIIYDIIDEFKAEDIEGHLEYEVLKTSKTIEKEIFPIFPIWDDKKHFRWLKKTKVRYRIFVSRILEFDDGWSYRFYWGEWKVEERIEEILK